MSIVDGKGLVTWEGGLFEPNSDLLHRVQWAFGKIRADGGTIILNEAGRPFGVPGDMQVRNAWQTASGISTVWFQWGRYQRGETPSAANPNSGALASEHTQGLAVDCNAPSVFDATLRAKYFGQVGMRQTISSESWHWAIRSNPTVLLASTVSTAAPTNNIASVSRRRKPMLYLIDENPGQPSNGDILAIPEGGIDRYRFTTTQAYENHVATVADYNGKVAPEYRIVQPPTIASLPRVPHGQVVLLLQVYLGKN